MAKSSTLQSSFRPQGRYSSAKEALLSVGVKPREANKAIKDAKNKNSNSIRVTFEGSEISYNAYEDCGLWRTEVEYGNETPAYTIAFSYSAEKDKKQGSTLSMSLNDLIWSLGVNLKRHHNKAAYVDPQFKAGNITVTVIGAKAVDIQSCTDCFSTWCKRKGFRMFINITEIQGGRSHD
jgi:hypothetical protein